MSAWAVFLIACACTGVLALTCTVIVWAVKNILEWADNIFDAIDDLKYTLNKRKKNKEQKKMMNPRFRVLNRDPLYDYREDCKITQGIDMALQNTFFTPKNGDETEYWIKQICANHSCIRSVHFRFVAEAPKSVVMQIIRATKGHPQPEVQSSRPDWTGKERSSDPYEEKLFAQDHTAESFIEMAKQRLCKKTEANTRKFMELLVETLKAEKDPFLKAVGYCCVPACEWLGGRCPEINCCGKCPKISEERIKLYHKGD